MMVVVATSLVAIIVAADYNIGIFAMVAYSSALYKQLYWEFGVSHNCIWIIS